MKIVICDPLCEPGHVATSSFFLNALQEEHEVIFIGDEDYAKLVGYKPMVTGRLRNPKSHTGLAWILANACILWRISILAKKNWPKSSIVILSYETVSFSICRLLFPNLRSAYIFNHNNIDQCADSAIRKWCFRTLSSPTRHLVYEKFIKDYLDLFENFDVSLVSHPLVFPRVPQTLGKTINIFSPHKLDDLTLDQVDRYANNNKNFRFRVKFYKNVVNEYLFAEPYFEDFERELRLANIVLIFTKFKYRSSGVAYAAIASGCTLIMRKCLFSIELSSRYKGQVILFESMSGLFDTLSEINLNRDLLAHSAMRPLVSTIESVVSD